MSLTAQLKFGDNLSGTYTKEYNVTDCKYSVMRHHNCYFPDSDAWCGNVEVTVIAPGKEDLELFEWYSDLQMRTLGFEACKTMIPFTRYVNERNDIGMRDWLKEHLSASDFNYWQELSKKADSPTF